MFVQAHLPLIFPCRNTAAPSQPAAQDGLLPRGWMKRETPDKSLYTYAFLGNGDRV